MLYGSITSLGAWEATGYFEGDNKQLVNKYYMHKYIKNTKNVLMVSSSSEFSIIPNITNMNKILNDENLLTLEQITEVENELEKYTLRHM